MVQKSENLVQAWEHLTDDSVINMEESMTYLTLEIAAKTFFDSGDSGSAKGGGHPLGDRIA